LSDKEAIEKSVEFLDVKILHHDKSELIDMLSDYAINSTGTVKNNNLKLRTENSILTKIINLKKIGVYSLHEVKLEKINIFFYF
jgi:hypothetical protein